MLSVHATSHEPDTDPVLSPSKAWETVTRYRVATHAKIGDASEAVRRDVSTQCRRLGLPVPKHVAVRSVRGLRGVGVVAQVGVTFRVVVCGPLLLGKDRHFGGGLFRHASRRAGAEEPPERSDPTPPDPSHP